MASNVSEKIRVPAPILTIIHIILAILLRRLAPIPVPMPLLIPWLGLGLAALGFIFGLMALTEFRRTRAASKKPTAGFVSTGIYRYTRNPIYLGFVLMLVGLSLSMGTYWGVILVWPLVVLMNALVIKPEEIHLEKRYKDQYIDYKSRVRRWL